MYECVYTTKKDALEWSKIVIGCGAVIAVIGFLVYFLDDKPSGSLEASICGVVILVVGLVARIFIELGISA